MHYKRGLYIVDETPEALALRGKLVDVHEMEDGTVHIRHGLLEFAATPFRKEGNVRQQDVADNKYLGTILEQIRQTQLASDEQKLTLRGTLREKRFLKASLEERRTNPTFLSGNEPDISTSR